MSCTKNAVCALLTTFILLLLIAGTASAATITVDDSGGADYTSIQEAVNNASGGDIIQVAAGTYSEHVVVNKSVTLQGECNSTTIIDGNGSGNIIEVTADGVTIEGFRIQNGSAGIYTVSSHNTFSDNTIADMTGQNGANNTADYGIGEAGGVSSGIYLSNTRNNTLIHNIITNTTGGTGGVGGRWGAGGAGGAGGKSSGIHLLNSTENTITGNTISKMTGGTGNTAGVYASGGAGGVSAGIYLSNSTDNTLIQNSLSNMTGGMGGTGGIYGSDGAAQVGYGIYLEPSSHKNTINITNTMDCDPIIYLYNATDTVIENHELSASSNPINLGKIVLINSSNITVQNNTIRNMTGRSGETRGYMVFADDGGKSCGIYLSGSASNTLTNNTISNITGGTGGVGGLAGSGGTGGKSSGIHLSGSMDNTITSNTITNMKGGTGGTGGDGSAGGTGGISCGIHLSGSTGNTFNANTLSSITGGIGGSGGTEGSDGATQVGYGIYLEQDGYHNTINPTNTVDTDPIIYLYNISGTIIKDYILNANSNPTNMGKIVLINSSDLTIQNNTISNMTGNAGNAGGYQDTAEAGDTTSGIYIPNSINCTIIGNTINNIRGGTGGTGGYKGLGGTGGKSYGIRLYGSTNTTLINNTINNMTGGSGGIGGFLNMGGTGGNAAGIYLTGATNDTIVGNNISNVIGGDGGYKGFTPPMPPGWDPYASSGIGYSLYLNASTFNLLFHNNLQNTDENAYDDASNSWDNGYPSGGNYWNAYNGTDTDTDGIGDTTYNISGGGSQDKYPLMQPWNGSNLFDITPPASITSLNYSVGYTWINWSWNNPTDTDFVLVIIFLENVFKTNITSPIDYYNATNLTAGTQYTISTHTVDTSGNINQTWVNHTAKTKLTGDLNNNGYVDIGDVAKVVFMVAGKVSEELSADFNNNGYVDIGDAAKIAFYLAGKVDEL